MGKKRVVITGMGAITPIGNNLKEYNQSLFNGISGCKPIKRFDALKQDLRVNLKTMIL